MLSSSPLLPPCVPPCWRVCLVVRPWGVALAPPLLHVHDNLLCDPGPLLMHAYVCPDVCNHSRRCCPTQGCCWLGCWQGEVVRCHQGLWLHHPQRWWCRSVCPSIHVRAVQCQGVSEVVCEYIGLISSFARLIEHRVPADIAAFTLLVSAAWQRERTSNSRWSPTTLAASRPPKSRAPTAHSCRVLPVDSYALSRGLHSLHVLYCINACIVVLQCVVAWMIPIFNALHSLLQHDMGDQNTRCRRMQFVVLCVCGCFRSGSSRGWTL